MYCGIFRLLSVVDDLPGRDTGQVRHETHTTGVDLVARTASQRPCSQVKSERRPRTKNH